MQDLSLNNDYKTLLQQVKSKIQHSQIQAMVKVNQTLLLLYREIGNMILERQEDGWRGAKIVEQLAQDLKREYPDMKGFSKRNLLFMRQFASTYPEHEIVKQLVSQISRGHNVRLMQKCGSNEERIWYAEKSLENGRSRNTLTIHIERKLFERQWKAVNNFSETLPQPQSDMAEETLKNPYLFDFLNLSEKAREKEIEDALVQHITNFLLELWKWFAYVGRQYAISVGKEDFYIDLLFYHLKLRCYVVVELKTDKFKAEYAGKLNFYLSAVDDILKGENDNPSIGILLCKSKEWTIAEYAIKDINKPIGISEFRLAEFVPEEIQNKLPTIEALEDELEKIDAEKSEGENQL